MKQPFKKLTIAVTGNFGANRGHGQMKNWIARNGGRFTTEISSGVTHLICSKEQYKKDVLMVHQASALKTIKIVSFDWLEDSLMSKTQSPKSEGAYLIGPRVKKEAATKARKKIVRKGNIQKGMEKFEQSCKEHEKEMSSSGYGLYHDPSDDFAYDITLARANLLLNKNERYQLKVCHPIPSQASTPPVSSPASLPPQKRMLLSASSLSSTPNTTSPPRLTPVFPMLFPTTRPRARAPLVTARAQRLQLYVTHDVPKSFSCNVKYSTPGANRESHVLAPPGSGWETAWGAFSSFFKLKTGKKWAERFVRMENVEILGERGESESFRLHAAKKRRRLGGVTSGREGIIYDGAFGRTYDSPYTPLPPPPPEMYLSPYTPMSPRVNNGGSFVCSGYQKHPTHVATNGYADVGPGEWETLFGLSEPAKKERVAVR
ncbi:hypothetical protein ABVK25_003711 [Lepraria finkii]|uniref:BRCT domain-containing protein n=1 Tax=Lepraria finkii TaxID=1340010 RepID=A0ABR4BDZ5_9LECA